MSDRAPGRQTDENAGRRRTFRWVGAVLALVGLACLVVALVDFLQVTGSDDLDAAPTKFGLFFVGLPLVVVGAWLLQAGYLGAVSSYVATEAAPAMRQARDNLAPAPATYCPHCGAGAAAGARFCASCGTALG
jgi:hypothetical protein